MKSFPLAALLLLGSTGLHAATPLPVSKAAPKTEQSFTAVDADLARLDKGLAELEDCVAAAEALSAGAARAEKRAKEGPVPSHLAGLGPTKRKLASKATAACVAKGTSLSSGFDGVITTLKTAEPPTSKGVMARRASAAAKRARINQMFGRLGGKPGKAKPAAGEKPEAAESAPTP